MYHYFRNAYVGWRKGVPRELYWPALWADTKCILYAGTLIVLCSPITLPLIVISVLAAAMTKMVELCAEAIGSLGEFIGARATMDKLNKERTKTQMSVREWHRANKSMRYQKMERTPNVPE